jgi:hemerythrin-like metal-binding protein
MLYIVWNQENQLGIPIIDEQHRGIVSAINSLYYFIQQGQGAEALKPTITVLAQYTALHFKTEEALMELAKYPGLAEHIILHQALRGKTLNLTRDPMSQGDENTLLAFLKDWWLGHINNEDRKYAPYVRKELGIK